MPGVFAKRKSLQLSDVFVDLPPQQSESTLESADNLFVWPRLATGKEHPRFKLTVVLFLQHLPLANVDIVFAGLQPLYRPLIVVS